MFELMVEDTFSAAHQLKGYKGECERLHGHTFRVQVFLQAAETGGEGMVLDFHIIKEKLEMVLAEFDHNFLNDLPYFKDANPTSENLARLIFDKLKKAIPQVSRVTVWESPGTSASYYQ
jgi:6-pyruvoyltetrahydropterin/6-carboxytetrahydropterin synthase